MKYDLDLQGRAPGDRLRFSIDLETGEITGEDADKARTYLDNPDGVWIIYGTKPVEAPDPLHDPRDLAVALCEPYWQSMPQELIDLLPPVESVPDGAMA